MDKKFGPAISAVILLLQSYKVTAFVPAELEQIFGPGLGDTYLKHYNEEFYFEGDVVDSFLERIFDILKIPRMDVLRILCGEEVLIFLTSKISSIECITRLLLLKQEYQQDPQAFIKKHSR